MATVTVDAERRRHVQAGDAVGSPLNDDTHFVSQNTGASMMEGEVEVEV